MRISDWSSDVCSSDLQLRKSWAYPQAGTSIVMPYDFGASRARLPHHLRQDQMCVDIDFLDHQFCAYGKRICSESRDEGSLLLFEILHPKDEKIGRASCRERVCQYV